MLILCSSVRTTLSEAETTIFQKHVDLFVVLTVAVPLTERQREKETETDRQRQTDRDRQTDKE